MAIIDIDTETGEIKMPMRRVSGVAEVRVRAWIELATMLGEWETNTASGLDYQAIYDGADDTSIELDVSTRLSKLPNVEAAPDVSVARTVDDDGLNLLTISATVVAFDTPITVSVGTST